MIKNFYTTSLVYIKAHKVLSGIVALIVIIIIVFGYKKTTSTSAQTRYVLGTVEKGTLITSVTGSGQIASVNQVDIKPKVSGDITAVTVQAGQQVKAGTIIARINATDALKTLRDAQINLTSAQISYQKSLQTSQNDISSAQQSLEKAYDDGFNAMSDAFSSLPTTMTDLFEILYNPNHSPYLTNSNLTSISSNLITAKDRAGKEYDAAKNEYDKNLADFKSITRTSDPAKIDALISETYQTVKDISTAEKDLSGVLNQIKSQIITPTAQLTADLSTVSDAVSKSNGYVSDLYSAKTAVANAEKSIAQKNTTLNGADNLDIESAKLTLAQRQAAVTDASRNLADYTVRAPFDGVIAKLDAKVADSASSGSVLATLITKDSYATLSLNEIDIAKVKVGEKATLTFDAIPDLSISGTVAEVDSLGTVSQGVVSYTVKIRFDTQDDRVKSGMSVSASIITGTKPDVLMVPSSAVKTSGSTSYVQVLDNVPTNSSAQTGITSATTPRQIPVEVGESNDTSVEITSGINEGDQIVTRTIAPTTAARTTTPTATGILGGGARTGTVRAGGNAIFGR